MRSVYGTVDCDQAAVTKLLDLKLDQSSFFRPAVLRALFESRIAKSQAVGLDGVRIGAFNEVLIQESEIISRKVLASTYRLTRYREKLISRGAERCPRQISIPTVRDRLAQRAACNALSAVIPDARSRPPHSHIKAIAEVVRATDQPLSFLRIDVRDFFPSIEHERLLAMLASRGVDPFLVDFIRKSVSTVTGGKPDSSPLLKGVPQGLSISNILSSVYMTELDKDQSELGNYHRYVDDVLIVAPSHEIKARYVSIVKALDRLGLSPHPMGKSGKTEEKRISEGIDYLGYNLSRHKISVRQSSVHRMFVNLLKVITNFRYKRNVERFLFKLNIRITGCIVDGKRRGWLMFFSQTEDLSQLSYLDKFVASQLDRIGLHGRQLAVARFVKAYHEIRFRGDESPYIPNFDKFDLNQMLNLIHTVKGVPLEELQSRSVEAIEAEFRAIVAREVADLEQDVLGSIS